MTTVVRWKPHVLVSWLHAAAALTRGLPLADARLSAALNEPATLLTGDMRSAGLSVSKLWRHLVPLAANLDDRRSLAETTITRLTGREDRSTPLASRLSAGVAAIEAAGRQALPYLAEELPLRERPLREQWEARGPGLLYHLGLLIDEALLPAEADVLLVHPALGGGGEAHLAYNSVRFEAVLANPHGELPETLRLAWLLSQLQLDLPRYSEQIHADRLPHVARFAVLPAVLVAAERVELARFDEAAVRRAIQCWRLPAPADLDAAALVCQWWETYQAARPPFPVALAALDQMFG